MAASLHDVGLAICALIAMRVASFLFGSSLHIALCLAAGAPLPEQTVVTSTTSAVLPKQTPTWTNDTHQVAGNFSLYDKLPGLWFETCANNNQNPPCTAYCQSNDTECLQAANFVVPACAGLWNTYNNHVFDWQISGGNAPSGWSTVLSTYGEAASPSTTTINVYTTFSTANTTLTRQNPTGAQFPKVTITPVHAVGNPVPSVTVETASPYSGVVSYITAPQPSCRYAALKTTNDCGQCSIYGGTVELLFWPPATSTTTAGAPIITRSTVWDGITLFSPTVYISLSTVYASNSCMQVGQNHTGTLLAMKPEDVSTQIHIGGKVAVYTYGRVDYADLVGLPPVDDYEAQPSCIMFGCSTIFPTYSPTLVVPLALRTLEADWSSCVAALEGLYDPPIALTEAAVAVSITMPSRPAYTEAVTTTTLPFPSASQCITPVAPTPTRTMSPGEASQREASFAVNGLESILNGGGSYSSHTQVPIFSSVLPSVKSFSLEVEPFDLTSGPVGTASNGLTSSVSRSHAAHVPEADGIGFTYQIPSSTLSAGLHSPPAASTPANPTSIVTSARNDHPQPLTVSQDTQSNFIVNGKTFAPDLPITLTRADTTLTASMITSNDQTYIALGTATTVPFDHTSESASYISSIPPVLPFPTSNPIYTAAGVTFGANTDGDLMIGSKTLQLGSTITLGSGSSLMTVVATTLGSQTAVVVGNTTTAMLVGQVQSSSGLRSSISIISNSTRPADGSSVPQSTTATPTGSTAAVLRVAGFANVLAGVLCGIVLGM